jgi:DNA-binding CsgD family transcriptional regulator
MSGHPPLAPSGLASFLTYLGAFPQPGTITRALVAGPLAPLKVVACLIWLADDDDAEMRLVTSYGGSDEHVDRYRTLSLKLYLPIVMAYKQCRTIISDMPGFVDDNAVLSLDRDLWDGLITLTGATSVLDTPIISGGVPIGSMGLLLGEKGPWTPEELDLILGITSALGSWLTHPRSGVAEYLSSKSAAIGPQLELSARQLRILELVEAGKSNASIARSLGYSESTVKQEVKAILRILRADSRHAAVDRARQVGLIS